MNLQTELRSRFARGSGRTHGVRDRHHRTPRLAVFGRSRRAATAPTLGTRMKELARRLRRTFR